MKGSLRTCIRVINIIKIVVALYARFVKKKKNRTPDFLHYFLRPHAERLKEKILTL